MLSASSNPLPSGNPSPNASLTAPPHGSADHLAASPVSGRPKHSMNTLVTAISAFLHTPNTVQLAQHKSPAALNIDSSTNNKRRTSTNSGKDPQTSDGVTPPPSPAPLGDQRELIREMFDGIDKRSRGWISVSATRRALSSFGVRLDHTDMEELLREVGSLKPHANASVVAAAATSSSTHNANHINRAAASPSPSALKTVVVEGGGVKDTFDLSGFDFPDDDDEEDLDFADLHSGGVGYHSAEMFSTVSNDGAMKTSFANLPYRQRQRDHQEMKNASVFEILQRVLGSGRGDQLQQHISGKHSVPLKRNVTAEVEVVVDEPRIIAVGPASSSNNKFNTDNNTTNANNDGPVKRMTSFGRDSTTSVVNQKVHSLLSARTQTLVGASGSCTPPPSGGRATNNSGSLPSTPITKVTFEMFHQMVMVWQTAARFRQFEERTYVAKEHLENGVRTQNFLPDSFGMFVWHCIVMGLSTCMIFAALSVFSYQERHLPRYLSMTAPFELAASLFFAVDIYLRFHTVVVKQGVNGEHLIDDTPIGIAKSYFYSPWLWIDLFCVLPLRFCFFTFGSVDETYLLTYNQTSGLILTGYEGCVNCSEDIDHMRDRLLAAKIFMVLRCVKYVEHLYYFHESRLVFMNADYVTRNFVFVPMFTALSNIAVTVQTLATVYLSKHPRSDAEVLHGGGLVLARAYYLILTCFATVGYGDIVPQFSDEWDRGFFIVLIIIAFIVNASVIGEAVSFFQRSDIDSRKSESLLELLAMCKYFCIPTGLRNEIISFYNHTASSDIMNSYGHKFEMIPVELRKGLQLMSRLRLIRQLPYFDDLHRSARLLLCNCLEKVTYCPEQYVIYAGEIGNEMFFLNHGFVDIFGAKGLYLVTLRHGNYFGEMAIIDPEPQKRAADVKAITYCEIYVLSKESFQDLLEKYPRLHSAVTDLADKRRKQTQLATKQATNGKSEASSPVGVPPPPPPAPAPAVVSVNVKRRQSLVKQVNAAAAAAAASKEMTIVVDGGSPVGSQEAANAASAPQQAPPQRGAMFVEDFSDHEGGDGSPLPGGGGGAGNNGKTPRGTASYDKSLGFAPLERHDSDPRDGTMAQRSGAAVTRASSVVAAAAVTPRNNVSTGGGVFGAGNGVALRNRSNSLLAAGGPPQLGGGGVFSPGRPQLRIEQSILTTNEDSSPIGGAAALSGTLSSDRTPNSEQRQIASLIDALENEIEQLMSFVDAD
ncbi:cation efflux transmembrane transport protein, putative [Bodo saltans]|uniref:Cation efflux transmembrane transport protein, putative n=1 Tax=Bodo saltans TaxID=75058 RepID=A0A0S4JEN8_BODSA|nr:cation efflux transmembrane transport protein, putative [Bodo saltans]|eukprot:CUG89848.1 cation efflux transmembrane transport protein, putative [Bodo saltans]